MSKVHFFDYRGPYMSGLTFVLGWALEFRLGLLAVSTEICEVLVLLLSSPLGFRTSVTIWGFGYRVQRFGFRVQDFGFRV